jgi:hypothetical protein
VTCPNTVGQPTLVATLHPGVRHLLGIDHPLLALLADRPQVQMIPQQLP